MSIFTLNEVQFLTENHRDVVADTSILNKYGDAGTGSSFRYPIDLGTLPYNHYINFQVYVREKINSEFGVKTDNGDPVAYMIRNALISSRGQKVTGGLFSDIQNSTSSLIDATKSAVSSAIADKLPAIDSVNSYFEEGITSRAPISIDAAGAGVEELTSLAPFFKDGQMDRDKFYKINQAANAIKKEAQSAFNTLKRAKESISLYMPDQLNFDYSHSYADQSLSSNQVIKGAQYIAAGAGWAANKNFKNVSPFISEIFDEKTKAGGTILGAFGYAVNPQYEVLYSSTALRQFQFDFLFTPRSEKEAEQVYNIIESLKFHSSPEILSGTSGRFLLAPSAFDIGFYYNGTRNPNIPLISTCVCENVSVDYAPQGFSAYETTDNKPGVGKTGTPVATRLSLRFKEITLVTKELIRGQTLSEAGISNDRKSSSRGSF
jgi:hypothetical protein